MVYCYFSVQKLFLASTKKEDPSYTGDGYTSLAVLYIVFAGFMWVVPSIISVIGAKVTLVIGSLGYRYGSKPTKAKLMLHYAGNGQQLVRRKITIITLVRSNDNHRAFINSLFISM